MGVGAEGGRWDNYLLAGTLAVKIPTVFTDNVIRQIVPVLVGIRQARGLLVLSTTYTGSRKAAVSNLSFGGLLLEPVLICPLLHRYRAFAEHGQPG